jgi:hypothetical protein
MSVIFIVRSLGPVPRELERRKPGHADVRPEQPAGQWLLCEVLCVQRDPRGGDVELVQVFPAKGARGDVGGGQIDRLQKPAFHWVPAGHLATLPQGDPEHALAVDRHAIRVAHPGRNADRDAAIGDLARFQVIIEAVDVARGGVDIVHRPVIQAPHDAVRDRDPLQHLVHAKIGVQAPQVADVACPVQGQGARPEPARRVALAVVKAVPGQITLGVGDDLYAFRLQIQAGKAMVHGQHQPS